MATKARVDYSYRPLVNVIIPFHNRPIHSKQTLDSLLKNTDLSLITLSVIDDGSELETAKIVHEFFQKTESLDLTITYTGNDIAQSPGVCRNMACDFLTREHMRGEFLYHSDNDVYFMEGWLEKLLSTYNLVEEKGIRLLGGGCHPYLQNKYTFDFPLNRVGVKDAVSGYSQLMKWETRDTYGGFDETMKDAERKIMGSEDWAFCQKIIQDGYLVGSIEPEVVIHCGQTNTYGDNATGHETFIQKEGIYIG